MAFTLWIYDESEKENDINLYDLTEWKRGNLNNILWDNKDKEKEIDRELNKALEKSKVVKLTDEKGDIRSMLPLIDRRGKMVQQGRLNIYRNKLKEEEGKTFISGFAEQDKRHTKSTVPYGFTNGTFVGFMDDNSLVRIKQEPSNRLSNKPDRIWFQLRPGFIDINLTKVQSCTPDKYGYCAYDLESAKATCTWFCITKALNGQYPVWANQYDIWQPAIIKEKESEWYALCFAFVLAENRCVVTKFEKDNPVKDAPEIFVDNPLSPNNKDSFWSTTLMPFINEQKLDKENAAVLLIEQITELYKYWNHHYCKGGYLYNQGLHTEPYFKYFDYPDFLTPNSGLIQIRKYAEIHADAELLNRFSAISKLSKAVKQQLYHLLVDDFKYFQ